MIHQKKYTLKDYELMFKDLDFLDDQLDDLRFECDVWKGKSRDKHYKFRSLFHLKQHYEKQHPKLTLNLQDHSVVNLNESDGAIQSHSHYEQRSYNAEEGKEPKQSQRYVDRKQRNARSIKQIGKYFIRLNPI